MTRPTLSTDQPLFASQIRWIDLAKRFPEKKRGKESDKERERSLDEEIRERKDGR